MNSLSTIACPRCGNSLEANVNSSMHCCIGCDGALVSKSALQPLLTQIAKEFAEDGCLNDVIVSVPDKCENVDCPHCNRPMEDSGYHSANKVKLDGCLRCWVVWTDADELAVMAAMHARSMPAHYAVPQQRAKGKGKDAHLAAIQRVRSSYRNVRF